MPGLCGTCAKSDATFVCGGCRSVYYCDSSCQRKHWKGGHKKACRKATRNKLQKISKDDNIKASDNNKNDKLTELTIFEYSMLLHDAFADNKLLTGIDKPKLMNICFVISFFVTLPNEACAKYDSQKYAVILNKFVNKNIAKMIISYIIDRSNYLKWVQFSNMDENDYHKYQNQVNYSCNNNVVDFANAIRDYVNIRTDLLLLNKKYYINIYCLGKNDELWLGIVSKKFYTPTFNARCYIYGLFYYGGRAYQIKRYGGLKTTKCHGWTKGDCNHGIIQGTDKIIKHPLNSYSKGDWINFEIDFINKTMIFYKNGIFEYKVDDSYFPYGECYFVVQVDTAEDEFYIEQAVDNSAYGRK